MTPAPDGEKFWWLPLDLATRPDLRPTDKLVYMAIQDRIGKNPAAWPGLRKLAGDCGLTPPTVFDAIARLERAGLVEAERVKGNPGGRTNHYRLAKRERNGTCKNPNVQKSERLTCKIPSADVQDSCTEPNPLNHTQLTRPNKRARRMRGDADPWQAVLDHLPTASPLRCERFKAAWLEWTDYRRQARKPLTAATVRRQIGQLAEWGLDGAIAAIEQSIGAGWAGLFPPKGNGRPGGKARAVPKLAEKIVIPDYLARQEGKP